MAYNFDKTLDHRYDNAYRWVQPEGRDDVIGMGTADLDYECAPAIKEACRKVMEENTYNYRIKPESYYDSVKSFYSRNYQLKVEKEDLFNIPGTLAAIRLLMACITKPGDYVITQAPTFGPVNTIAKADCKPIYNNLVLKNGRYELDLNDFEAKVKEYHPSAFLLINPHNPTGRVFTKEELSRMVNICKENHVIIISDEVHSLVVYDGLKHTPILAVPGAKEVAIQVLSLSKGYNVMSLPHAILVIQGKELNEKWKKWVESYDFYYASNSYAIAAVTAIMSGKAEDWMKENCAYLTQNRKALYDFLNRSDIPMKPYMPEASFMMWADCSKTGIRPEDLVDAFMNKAGISLDNGLEFGEQGRGFVRINYAVTHANLQLAMQRIEKMFK